MKRTTYKIVRLPPSKNRMGKCYVVTNGNGVPIRDTDGNWLWARRSDAQEFARELRTRRNNSGI